MGSVEPYETRSGRRYRVLYRRPDHAQTSKRGFETVKAARLFLAGVDVDQSRGTYIDPSKTRITLADWLDSWLAGRSDLRLTSRERAEGIVLRHIKPALGRYAIGNLTHKTVQDWAGGLSATQSPSSVRKIVNVLSGALQLAVKDGRLPSNPAHGLNLPKVGTNAKRYLTHDQVRDLSDAVDALGRGQFNGNVNGYGLLVRVLAYCGLR